MEFYCFECFWKGSLDNIKSCPECLSNNFGEVSSIQDKDFEKFGYVLKYQDNPVAKRLFLHIKSKDNHSLEVLFRESMFLFNEIVKLKEKIYKIDPSKTLILEDLRIKLGVLMREKEEVDLKLLEIYKIEKAN